MSGGKVHVTQVRALSNNRVVSCQYTTHNFFITHLALYWWCTIIQVHMSLWGCWKKLQCVAAKYMMWCYVRFPNLSSHFLFYISTFIVVHVVVVDMKRQSHWKLCILHRPGGDRWYESSSVGRWRSQRCGVTLWKWWITLQIVLCSSCKVHGNKVACILSNVIKRSIKDIIYSMYK